MNKGHVYVVETEEGVKIGSSGNPDDRIKTLHRLHKFEGRTYVSKAMDKYVGAEGRVHRAVENHRLKGEYFSIPFDEAVLAVKSIEEEPVKHAETMEPSTDKEMMLTVGCLHESNDLNREVDVTNMVNHANIWRALHGMPQVRLTDILNSVEFAEFLEAAQEELPGVQLIRKEGQHISSRVCAHIYLAIYIAEQLSPEFHVEVIASFCMKEVFSRYKMFNKLDGKEMLRLQVGLGGYAERVEELLRTKLLGPEAEAGDWDKASIAQTHSRYNAERRLVDYLQQGLVRDWNHLKELINKL